jgi:hypothetical protein
MSPRIQSSRHAMPYPGPYPAPRAQPVLSRNVPYSPASAGGAFDDATPRHYALSSNGAYTRNLHNQGPSWSNNQKSVFPDQAPYAALPQGSFTMNPVDAVYSQAMRAGYEAIAPLETAANVFDPMVTAPAGRHQVFNEQEMMLPLEMNDFETCLPNGGVPYSRHTTWTNGQPSPVGSDCMLANSTMTTGPFNRHGVPVIDLEMTRGISPYELVESDPFSHHR